MVEIGHTAPMRKKKRTPREIAWVGYNPPASYGLDLEIFPFSEARQRVGMEHLRTPRRLEFYALLYFTEGRCTHMVDFEELACQPGSLLVMRPGQVHHFDTKTTDWQGWLVLFRPEFLQPQNATTLVSELEAFHQLEDLPVQLTLNEREQEAVAESVTRMFQDAHLLANANTKALHALLRNQLLAVLVRLHLIQVRHEQAERVEPVLLHRFKQYRLAVDRELHHLHRVADYAQLLGCSEKSLSRAALEVAGMSAKAFLSRRIALEAKRLLVHTGLPVLAIADKLGFDEATNFVKFFRREVGCVPGSFRKHQAAR